ncbi:paraquat-inducible protein A [Pseudomonas putida S11]|nr:paraquat-inducible protein A [Pseudomonas putida S11]
MLLFVPANFLPIMQLHLLGQTSDDTVWSGVLGLYNSEMRGVAVVVFLCSMAIPLAKLLCQLVVLLSIRLNVGRSFGLLFYRIYHHLRDWGMLEVYFMGVLVAIVKLVDLAELTVGRGAVLLHQPVIDPGVARGGDVTASDLECAIRGGPACGRLMQAFLSAMNVTS